MLEVDLHTHTLFSACGIHTHLEVLQRARELGMKAIAVTDHGPALDSKVPGPFFDRLKDPVPNIRLLKGIECNLVGSLGEIDLPLQRLPHLDIVLLGIHHNTPRGLGKSRYTKMLVKAIEANPAVDIIVHPNDTSYPLDFHAVASAAAKHGVAIELNNSKTALQRIPDDVTRELVVATKQSGALIVVGSDTHAIQELGCDSSVRPFLEELAFPEERIVSRSEASALEFLDERRPRKKLQTRAS